MNLQNIGNHPERISSIKPFIDQYNWEGIDFPAGIKDWKKFEWNNKTIALNILYVPHNAKTINLTYKSKCNHKRENQVVLLVITTGEKWHYIALKSVPTDDGFNCPIRSLSRLFRGITSNKFYKEQKECHICQKEFRYDKNEKKKSKLYQKVRGHCHYTRKFRGAAHSICNLRYKVPQEIPVKIHNGSKYDYHFIIRELAEEFKG